MARRPPRAQIRRRYRPRTLSAIEAAEDAAIDIEETSLRIRAPQEKRRVEPKRAGRPHTLAADDDRVRLLDGTTEATARPRS